MSKNATPPDTVREQMLDTYRRTILDSLDELAKLGCDPYEELSRAVEHVFMEPEEEDR